MRVTEQIDALETLAYDPLAYLVVPRVLAGVRANRRYIITHPHRLSDVTEYYGRMWDDYDAAVRIADEIEAAG